MGALAPGQAVFTWDYRQPAPMDEIADAVRELSGGTVRMSMPETGSDEYQLVISRAEPKAAPSVAERKLEVALTVLDEIHIANPIGTQAHDAAHSAINRMSAMRAEP